MQGSLKIALVVATYGRRDCLRRLFNSLCAQSYGDFELAVVDQNPDGYLRDIIGDYRDRLNIVHMVVNPSGASAARNVGLSLVKNADIVAFPDDDCWYEPDTLQQVVDFFLHNPACGCVVGKWKDGRREEVDRYRVFYQAGTCFFFLRKTWADAIGGFDESLGPGPGARYIGGEDTDYLLRGMEKGMNVLREPDIQIRHPDLPADAIAIDKVFRYGVARMALLREYAYPLWFRLANVVFPLFRLVLHPRCARYWWAMFRGRLKGLVER